MFHLTAELSNINIAREVKSFGANGSKIWQREQKQKLIKGMNACLQFFRSLEARIYYYFE